MKSLIFIIIIFLSFCIACETELEFTADDFPPVLVLNGVVEQDSLFIVNVSRSGEMNEPYQIADLFVDDAVVKLYDGENYIETLISDSLGFYHSVSVAQGGKLYTISAEKNGFPTVTAKLDFTVMPVFSIKDLQKFINDTVYIYDFPEPGGEINLYRVNLIYTLVLHDNGGENNYYSTKTFTENRQIIYHGNPINPQKETHLGDLTYDNVGAYFYNQSDFEKYEEYFHHLNTSNHLGFSLDVMDDKLFNGKNAEFIYQSFFTTPEIKPVDFIVKSYPDELMKYYSSLQLYVNTINNPYSEPVNVYSNVENGIGFVCGVPSSKINVDIR